MLWIVVDYAYSNWRARARRGGRRHQRMATFRITPHGRLQEWVADEKGYFRDEGLDYEFVYGTAAVKDEVRPSVEAANGNSLDTRKGAFESMEAGRACDISSACHWMLNMAASASHGMMWGHAYSVVPGGLFVP